MEQPVAVAVIIFQNIVRRYILAPESSRKGTTMKLKALGCSGAEFPGHHTSSFLIDSSILLDAGTVGAVLDEDHQFALKSIFITHSHFDHIKGIPLLADNLALSNQSHNVKLVSTPEILQVIRLHLMNNVIWPDFSRIPSFHSPVLSYVEISPGKPYKTDGYTVTAYPVNHSVPAVGYIVRKGGKSLLYTGDTGPTDLIWEAAGELSALIVEVSLPDRMGNMAALTGHMTPALLLQELTKLGKRPRRILVTHLKPQYQEEILTELELLKIDGLEILTDGAAYDI